MLKGSRLETPRLVVRPFGREDAPPLVALFADPDVARFVDDGAPLAPDEANLWVVRSRENVERHGYGTGAVIERATGALVGWAGFARPEGLPEEVIYGFAQSRWGRGYGGELLDAIVALARDRLEMAEVRATVHPLNARSVRLLAGRGFQPAPPDPERANARLYVRRFTGCER